MIYGGRGLVETAETMLKESGFAVSQVCCSRPSCFDFVARKNENVILVKAQSDIDNVSPEDSLELRQISETVSASPLLVSERTREKPLEDDTVYSRYDVFAVTLRTFDNIVTHQMQPLIQAGPGGYYVEIDGETVKRRRQELDLSAGELAKAIGISRRTLYCYEQGIAKASVSAAYNLVYTLGIPAAKAINIFDKRERKECRFLATAKRVIAGNKLLTKFLKRTGRHQFLSVHKAPFDFVIAVPGDKMRIIGGLTGGKDTRLGRRVNEILSISEVVQAHPLLITDGHELHYKEIPCICSDELSKMESLEDLVINVT